MEIGEDVTYHNVTLGGVSMKKEKRHTPRWVIMWRWAPARRFWGPSGIGAHCYRGQRRRRQVMCQATRLSPDTGALPIVLASEFPDPAGIDP